jgi:SAM-dependent methyltransferase
MSRALLLRSLVVLVALLSAGCGGAARRGPGDAHAHREGHGHHHAHGDRVAHDEMSAAEYAARLEPADRDVWQQPVALLAAIGVPVGGRVADVGTGSGYFLPHLSRAVGPSGSVTAEDIRADFLELVRARAVREHLDNVEARLGTADDPRLEPGAYDLILFVDTYHHVADRPVFLAHLARALRPGGRLVIVDFREGALPVGPPPEHKIALAQVEREVRAAGFAIARTHTFLPHQWVLELVPRAALVAPSACVPRTGVPCPPRGERPRVVLDESLTPTEAGLPAVSADGAEVALVVGDADGASSSLRVRFVASANGAELREHVVLSVEEALALEEDAPDAATRARIEQRVADLDAAMMRGAFTSLASGVFAARGATRTPRLVASVAGLSAEFDPTSRTLVVRAADGHERLSTVLEPGTSQCNGRSVAHRPVPATVWADAARGVLVARVQYADERGCRGTPSVDRVFRLAP